MVGAAPGQYTFLQKPSRWPPPMNEAQGNLEAADKTPATLAAAVAEFEGLPDHVAPPAVAAGVSDF
jgi:hypothetical protein